MINLTGNHEKSPFLFYSVDAEFMSSFYISSRFSYCLLTCIFNLWICTVDKQWGYVCFCFLVLHFPHNLFSKALNFVGLLVRLLPYANSVTTQETGRLASCFVYGICTYIFWNMNIFHTSCC